MIVPSSSQAGYVARFCQMGSRISHSTITKIVLLVATKLLALATLFTGLWSPYKELPATLGTLSFVTLALLIASCLPCMRRAYHTCLRRTEVGRQPDKGIDGSHHKLTESPASRWIPDPIPQEAPPCPSMPPHADSQISSEESQPASQTSSSDPYLEGVGINGESPLFPPLPLLSRVIPIPDPPKDPSAASNTLDLNALVGSLPRDALVSERISKDRSPPLALSMLHADRKPSSAESKSASKASSSDPYLEGVGINGESPLFPPLPVLSRIFPIPDPPKDPSETSNTLDLNALVGSLSRDSMVSVDLLPSMARQRPHLFVPPCPLPDKKEHRTHLDYVPSQLDLSDVEAVAIRQNSEERVGKDLSPSRTQQRLSPLLFFPPCRPLPVKKVYRRHLAYVPPKLDISAVETATLPQTSEPWDPAYSQSVLKAWELCMLHRERVAAQPSWEELAELRACYKKAKKQLSSSPSAEERQEWDKIRAQYDQFKQTIPSLRVIAAIQAIVKATRDRRYQKLFNEKPYLHFFKPHHIALLRRAVLGKEQSSWNKGWELVCQRVGNASTEWDSLSDPRYPVRYLIKTSSASSFGASDSLMRFPQAGDRWYRATEVDVCLYTGGISSSYLRHDAIQDVAGNASDTYPILWGLSPYVEGGEGVLCEGFGSAPHVVRYAFAPPACTSSLKQRFGEAEHLLVMSFDALYFSLCLEALADA